MNEAEGNDPSVCPTFALLNARLKALLGGVALTSYATDKGVGDVCVAASGIDVLGFNTYPGWYTAAPGTPSGNVQADIEANVASVATTLAALAAWMGTAHPAMPFFVSEIGAGSIPGWADEQRGMWTDLYAARIVGAAAAAVLGDARFSGIALWQLMDQRVYNVNSALTRPRSFNNKGTLDEHRKPKLPVWSAVFNAFHGLPQPDWMAAIYPTP